MEDSGGKASGGRDLRKEIFSQLKREVASLCQKASWTLREDVFSALKEAEKREGGLPGRILQALLENVRIAREEKIPLCQDTGITEVFLEIGKGVEVEGRELIQAVEEGVKEGYRKGKLRPSLVEDPVFSRKNTQTNTPSLVHFIFSSRLEGKIRITVFLKGFGSENMGRVFMLSPGAGEEGVKEAVLRTVKEAGANPCPPVIVGVGIGGDQEKACFLAKWALLRPLPLLHPESSYRRLEKELKELINGLGIGVQGMGGKLTCLGVKVEHFPTHMAGLPLAVNISCYALREAKKEILLGTK